MFSMDDNLKKQNKTITVTPGGHRIENLTDGDIVICDLQDYSGERALKDYGQTIENVVYRFYVKPKTVLLAGDLFKVKFLQETEYEEQVFRVAYISKAWTSHREGVLQLWRE